MRPNIVPDLTVADRLFNRLRAETADPSDEGVTRDAYGPGEAHAHALVREEAVAIGLACHADHAGNLHMTLPGADPARKRLLIGSHLDSVARGGNYDGAAGVLAGLSVAAGLRRAGYTPACDITVLALRAEEAGAWFPTSYPGSRAALGTLPADALSVRRLDTGRTLADHMADAGFNPDAVRAGTRSLDPAGVAAYVEVHIEQGPVLDAAEIPVGIVTGIPGSRRYRAARVIGETNHSGGTPRAFRRDAAIAAAELAFRTDEAWQALDMRGREMVCTFCVLGTTESAAFTKIAGEARFELDVRSVDMANVEALFAAVADIIPTIEARRGVRVDLGPMTGSAPSRMDADLQDALARAAEAAGVPARRMASGGGHDAAAFAQAGVPAGMLFVRNQNGSHNAREAMRADDFAAACRVLSAWAVAAST